MEFYEYKPGDKIRILPPSISDYQSIGRVFRSSNDIVVVDYPYMIGSSSSGKSDIISNFYKAWKRKVVASERKVKIKKILG